MMMAHHHKYVDVIEPATKQLNVLQLYIPLFVNMLCVYLIYMYTLSTLVLLSLKNIQTVAVMMKYITGVYLFSLGSGLI